ILLKDRFEMINNLNPDLLISLHVNSSIDKDKNGLITYISKDNIDFETSDKVGNSLMAKLTKTDLKCEHLSLSNLKILTKVNCPSVLIDAGYISNDKDLNYINSKKGQTEIAQSIVDFINGKNSFNDEPKFIIPIKEKKLVRMASGYGMRTHPITKEKKMHNGMDFIAPKGTPIVAAERGTVVKAQYEGEYGNVVYINHINGFQTRYVHMSEILVEVNTQINKGTILGKVGSTGKSVSPHLHFEILKDNRYVNPKDYLPHFKSKKKTHISSPSKYSVSEKFLDFELPLPITVNSKTTNSKIGNFNKQFDNLDSKIRITQVDRNTNNEIIGFNIQTKFIKQKRFNTNMGIKSENDDIVEVLKIYPLENEFKIETDVLNKNVYSIIDKDGVKLFFDGEITLGGKEIKKIDSNQYKIKKGDTFYSIAKKHNTTISKLEKLNPGFNGNLVEGVWMYVKDDVKNNSGSINYNNLTYYYSIVNNIVRFYDKFGNESNQSLSDNLLIKLNNKNFTTYTLREIIKNNNYKFDKFSIVIDKTKTEKELQAILLML
ncbi:MAG TPA: LysM peptidoglycan-binding domain-containing protein, partial [Flavobacteriaceae bacterium]|nr:LysM peptidoglycan-binding domain-containing protein [Flavobacteriaceae bacterium]